MKNGTWVLVDKVEAKGRKLITSKWVLRIKDNGNYRARLVSRGFQQQGGIDFDYDEIFSPVANSSSIRTLICIAVQKGMTLAKFDVKTAFLYGTLEKEVYMQIPEGFEQQDGKVCKLIKALYGLKQSSARWSNTLTDFLTSKNLIRLKSDHCIFKSSRNDLYIAIHVDDGLIAAMSSEIISEFFGDLENQFEITTEMNPKEYLGIQIEYEDGKIRLSQGDYARNVLENFGMENAKTVSTPMVPNYEKNPDPLSNGKFGYRAAVGSLLYLSNKTRPDIAYAVSHASRSLEAPTESNVESVKRILKYLHGHEDDGIIFEKKKGLTLEAYSDSDFAGDKVTRRSTTGFVIMLNGSPITWGSRRQDFVTLSSTEAELVAAAETVKECLYSTGLIFELIDVNLDITLYAENLHQRCLCCI